MKLGGGFEVIDNSFRFRKGRATATQDHALQSLTRLRFHGGEQQQQHECVSSLSPSGASDVTFLKKAISPLFLKRKK